MKSALLFGLSLLGACSADTAILVRVEADPQIADDVRSLQLEIWNGEEMVGARAREWNGAAETLSLRHGALSRRATIRIRGEVELADGRLVRRLAEARFVPGDDRDVCLYFGAACAGLECGSDDCRSGACEPVVEGPRECVPDDIPDAGSKCEPVHEPAPDTDPWLVRAPAEPFGRTFEEVTTFTDVYLENAEGTARVGARLDWGGTIAFLGDTQAASNVLDTLGRGRGLVNSLYDPSRAYQGCAWNASCLEGGETCGGLSLGWNPAQAGDQCNNNSIVIEQGRSGDALRIVTQPVQRNPAWASEECTVPACPTEAVPSDVTFTSEIRFVAENVVEVATEMVNDGTDSHTVGWQEAPALYAGNGSSGVDLPLLVDADGAEVTLTTPISETIFMDNFDSPEAWIAWQTQARDAGIALVADEGVLSFEAWRDDGAAPYRYARPRIEFGLPAKGTVRTITYLGFGDFDSLQTSIRNVLAARPPFGSIDTPVEGDEVRVVSGETFLVAGWVLDGGYLGQVRVEIDGVLQRRLPVDESRDDVCTRYPGYRGCPLVGFAGEISTEGLSLCPHLVRVIAEDADGNETLLGERALVVQ